LFYGILYFRYLEAIVVHTTVYAKTSTVTTNATKPSKNVGFFE